MLAEFERWDADKEMAIKRHDRMDLAIQFAEARYDKKLTQV